FDPPEDDFPSAVRAALAMRGVLVDAGLRGAAKTSGSKGVHLFVPIQRRYPFPVVFQAAQALAERLAGAEPDLTTVAFAKAERGGRVLIDVRRNAPGQHTAAAYSPR